MVPIDEIEWSQSQEIVQQRGLVRMRAEEMAEQHQHRDIHRHAEFAERTRLPHAFALPFDPIIAQQMRAQPQVLTATSIRAFLGMRRVFDRRTDDGEGVRLERRVVGITAQ